MTAIRFIATACGLALLAACSPATTGANAGASAGVTLLEERGLAATYGDAKIRTQINYLWFNHDVEMYRKVGLTIYEGRVMLTGIVSSEKMHQDAVRLTLEASGVREILDEIQIVTEGQGALDQGRDVLIAQKMKYRLLTDKLVTNINYSVDVVGATIYLMGIAQDDAELARVLAHARDITGVKEVVSHVLLKNDPRRNPG